MTRDKSEKPSIQTITTALMAGCAALALIAFAPADYAFADQSKAAGGSKHKSEGAHGGSNKGTGGQKGAYTGGQKRGKGGKTLRPAKAKYSIYLAISGRSLCQCQQLGYQCWCVTCRVYPRYPFRANNSALLLQNSGRGQTLHC